MFIIGAIQQYIVTVVIKTVAVLTPHLVLGIRYSPSRIPRIPRYIRLLLKIYLDSQPGSKIRQITATSLLILGSLLSVMLSSFVPSIGFPILGAVTNAIAIYTVITVILFTLDAIEKIDEDYLTKSSLGEYEEDLKNAKQDLEDIAELLGPAWNKIRKQLTNLYESVAPKIDEFLQNEGTKFAEQLDSYFKESLSDLILFLDTVNGSKIELKKADIKKIEQGLEPVLKVSVSLTEGLVAGGAVGATATGVSTSVFVQAGFWTSIQALLGINTGIVVSASMYTLLTVAAPIGLGIGATAGVFGLAMKKRSQEEERRRSKLLADILIASLAMAHADGIFSKEEEDVFHQLLLNAAITDEDRDRVYQAFYSPFQFEDILIEGLLLKRGSKNAEYQYILLLVIAWEVAKADGRITQEEIDLHNRMAAILQVEREVVEEIRRLVSPGLGFMAPSDSQAPFLWVSATKPLLEAA